MYPRQLRSFRQEPCLLTMPLDNRQRYRIFQVHNTIGEQTITRISHQSPLLNKEKVSFKQSAA